MSIIEPTSEVIENTHVVDTKNPETCKDIYVQRETQVSANVKEIIFQTNIRELEEENARLEADIASFNQGIIDYTAKINKNKEIIIAIKPLVEEEFAKKKQNRQKKNYQ